MTTSSTKFRPQLTIEEVNLIVESLHILLLKGQEFESDPIGTLAPALYKKMNLFAHKSMLGINTPAYKTKPKKVGEERRFAVETHAVPSIRSTQDTGTQDMQDMQELPTPEQHVKQVTPAECYEKYIELGTEAETQMSQMELMLAAVGKSKFTKDLTDSEQTRLTEYFKQYL